MANIYPQPSLQGGLDEVLTEVAVAVPQLPIGLLMFVWATIFLGGTATQKTRSGYADSPMWATMASSATLMITIFFSFRAGIINILVLSVVVAITIFSGLWLFLSKGRGEF